MILNIQDIIREEPRRQGKIYLQLYPLHHPRQYTLYRGHRPTHIFWFNVGPASQPIAGSMLGNRLRRWPNTNPSLGLLYHLRKRLTFTQFCFFVDPQSSTLARHWNSTLFSDCCTVMRVTLSIPAPETPIPRYIGPMLPWCWATDCNAGLTLLHPKPFKL